MKCMIVSDIHGSYEDFKRIVEIFEEEHMKQLKQLLMKQVKL